METGEYANAGIWEMCPCGFNWPCNTPGRNGYTIVTKDNDFLDLLELKGFPPKVVLLKTGNNSSKALADLLINAKPTIEELENSEYGLLEIYGPLGLVKNN
jgi:predicted nuclease of predicted toxin-antitoxin system